MNNNEAKSSEFVRGVKAGLPISLGYVMVAFTLGIASNQKGISMFFSMLMSALCFTGTGQSAAMNLMENYTFFLGVALTILIVNLRCFMLSLTLAQRIDPNTSFFKRILFGFANADEIFAIAIQEKGYIGFDYFMGMLVLPYVGWLIGTITGYTLGMFLPQSFLNACGIALYGMFLALIVPAAKSSKPMRFVVIFAAALSSISDFCLRALGIGIPQQHSVIIGSIIVASVAAIKYPIKAEEEVVRDDTLDAN